MSNTLLNDIESSLSLDNFRLFGMAPQFDVNLSLLRSKYKALMLKYHPDCFVNEDRNIQSKAMQIASKVNHAYECISSSSKRAAYLLELEGVLVNQNSNLVSDPEFLTEQLKLRESLAEAEFGVDPGSLIQKICDEALELQRQEEATYCELYEKLKIVSQAEEKESILPAVTSCVQKLRFLEKLLTEAEALQHKLLD